MGQSRPSTTRAGVAGLAERDRKGDDLAPFWNLTGAA
jgi:hypothetical protein